MAATKEELKALIDAKIYENRRREISATNLNGVLKEMVDASAGFGEATADVDSSTGVPSVEVVTYGPDTAKQFHFAFHNIKGEKGDKGDKVVMTYDPVNKMLIISDSDARVENKTLIL